MVNRTGNGLRPIDFLTVPNAVSALRIVILPFLIWGLATDSDALVFGALVVGFLSDSVDGVIARRLGVLSQTGRIVDPVADKLAIGTGFIGLSYWRELPWNLTILVLLRDVLIVAMSLYVYARRRQLPSSTPFGQATVTVLALTLFVYAARWSGAMEIAHGICVGMIAVSLVLYARRTTRILAGKETGIRVGGGLNWLEPLVGPLRQSDDGPD